MSPKNALAIGVIMATCLMGFAASGQAQKQDKKDPQAIYEPASKPGKGQKFLERFVGEWDVDKAFFSQTGQASRSKGTCKQSLQQGGRFLYSEFVFGTGPAATTGLGIIGYEPDNGLFTSVWIDSRQTKMSLRQSREPFNGNEVVLFSGTLKEGGKESRRTWTVTRLEEEGRKIIHRQFTQGQDGKERIMMELIMTRRGTP